MSPGEDTGGDWAEEIQGAAPALARGELRRQRMVEQISVNRYLYRQLQQLERSLLNATDLESFLLVILRRLPGHLDFPACELWLYDPEELLGRLISDRQRYGRHLRLMRDVFDLQNLYGPEPDLTLIDATDSRMFEILKAENGISHALLMPLLDSGRLVGSLHWGLDAAAVATYDDADVDLLRHLGEMISVCFRNAVGRQRLAMLSLLDLQTEIANRRSFESEIAREIARARRAGASLSLLSVLIDEYDDLVHYRGVAEVDFLVKKIAQRVASGLRLSDSLARLADDRLAVLLPSASEVAGGEIAERLRTDLDEHSIDDGRGGVIHVSLSIGVSTWEPQAHAAIDMRRLARQMEVTAAQACDRAAQDGGNQVQVARLKTLIL